MTSYCQHYGHIAITRWKLTRAICAGAGRENSINHHIADVINPDLLAFIKA
jgi:hypothetical protein